MRQIPVTELNKENMTLNLIEFGAKLRLLRDKAIPGSYNEHRMYDYICLLCDEFNKIAKLEVYKDDNSEN